MDGSHDAKKTPRAWSRHSGSKTTFAFLYAVCAIEGADLQLLPASFRALEVHLGLTPSSLAFLALCQALAQWTCTPIWGSLADRGFSRKRLLGCGALAWGTVTLLSAFATDYHLMVALRILNGMALGSLSPISQSLLVDATSSSDRGQYFGWVQFSSNVGNVLCALGTSTISQRIFLGYIEGWRVAFAAVAALSVILALAVFIFMPEPPQRPVDEAMPTIAGEMSRVWRYLRIPTFRVIVLQGMFGCIPWSAMSFALFYFQYVGVSDFGASALFSTSMIGSAIGGVLGGIVGDRMAVWSRRHGRPLTAQISVASGIPLIAMILARVPRDPSYFNTYAVLVFIFGLVSSWCAPGVNRPILSEIVDEPDRASVFAWLVTIDGSFAALFGAPMVGLLAEHAFGYQPSQLLISHMPYAQRQSNAAALAAAILWCTIGPWILCLLCFSFLHITYGQDVAEKTHCREPSATGALVPKAKQ